jgi:microcin C transport system substrate-binding protein
MQNQLTRFNSIARKGIIGRVFLITALLLSPVLAQATGSMALGYVPKYPSDFKSFDYVNSGAPKGGELDLSGFGNFDRLNPFLLKGISADGLSELAIEPLMEQSLDEPYSLYGLIAEDIALADDELSVTFRLNPKVTFSDGKPVTTDDVLFTFNTLRSDKAHPFYRLYWGDVKDGEIIDKRTIRFNFNKVNPELHLILAQMPVFARHWIGDRAFDEVVMDKPIGSGPYVVESFDLGKTITYKRNPDYWAKDLNVRRGMFNFDKVVIKYYKDETVQLEALKAGEFNFNLESNSKMWARDYVGSQFTSGEIIKKEFKHSNNAGMQGFVFNLRRDLFKDKRVRRALVLAFDFEWSNENLFYGQYKRCDSYFSNSELASRGLPEGKELAILNEFRDQLPSEVFAQEWRPPVNNSPTDLRNHLREAKKLLNDAGWHVKDGVLQNAAGQKFTFEVTLMQKGFERILAPYGKNLEKLGIEMKYRTVDTALYQRRIDTFDFDMVVQSFGQSQSPGNELLNYWHSSAADQEGSRNAIGIKDPVVDALIEKVIHAKDRSQLVVAARALDRVLLHGEYLMPNWYIDTHRVAYRKNLAYPMLLPLYYGADSWALKTWWRQQ